MTNISAAFFLKCLFPVFLLCPLASYAQSDDFPMLLESKDPAKPLEIIFDKMETDPEREGGIGLGLTSDLFKVEIGLYLDEATLGLRGACRRAN